MYERTLSVDREGRMRVVEQVRGEEVRGEEGLMEAWSMAITGSLTVSGGMMRGVLEQSRRMWPWDGGAKGIEVWRYEAHERCLYVVCAGPYMMLKHGQSYGSTVQAAQVEQGRMREIEGLEEEMERRVALLRWKPDALHKLSSGRGGRTELEEMAACLMWVGDVHRESEGDVGSLARELGRRSEWRMMRVGESERVGEISYRPGIDELPEHLARLEAADMLRGLIEEQVGKSR